MKNKNKGEAANFTSNLNLNCKLSVHHLNTPHQFGQQIFPKMMGVYSENQKKQNQCFHCGKWFDWLPFGAVQPQGISRGVYVGICKGCIGSLSILPPNLQKGFWQKVEKNLKNALEVKVG